MSLRGTADLSLDQAPPLSIPASFFLTAPVAVAAAGLLLIALSDVALASSWQPATVALTHLGTLGFLTTVMLGALYQMLPVVAGVPVPAARLAHGVHAALGLGVSLSVYGALTQSRWAAAVGGLLLGGALLVFIVPVLTALARASGDATVWGMRLALGGLLALLALGLMMGLGYAGGAFPGDRRLWILTHLSVGLLGWVGALLVSVSWKVVPMFYMTAEPSQPRARASVALIGLGLAGPLAALALGLGFQAIAAAAAPAAIVVWFAHPLATLRAIAQRRRPRADGSLRFWQAGLGCALLCGPLAAGAVLVPSPVLPLLFGWVAIWGWAGMVMHGMLCRIAPFLVWFHRLSPLIGVVPVPPMRRILPDPLINRGLGLHLSSVLLGAVAIATGAPIAVTLTGVSLVLVGAHLGYALIKTFSVRAPEVSPG